MSQKESEGSVHPAIHWLYVALGSIKTPLLENLGKKIHSNTPEFTAYLQPYKRWYDNIEQVLTMAEGIAASVDVTSRAIVHAATAPRPLTRYIVGYDANLLGALKFARKKTYDFGF